ncbi:class I SAM-dependent methyltransferase [Branchiibius sp. NY16-3462-2]|uniref:class I SAM-dependent methyltransferase n=1 Tax=Branchiibius sp. NY16-3462-2 TaxID=1807500 RepID=UPI00079A3B4B|nr:class I SAM-dependent methyltransferase [Branchiibius sp. NY16-3462-2]KYH44350.1 hypothetical protein AZH51_07375 [Branchiibius sp. NY16-3462-2]
MDTAKFLAAVPALFDGDPQTTAPSDPRWQGFVDGPDAVTGFTGPNELAVLHAAANLLPPDEVYLEVGTFKGRSLCAAVQDAQDQKFYAMENFLEFGMAGQEARAELETNLEQHASGAQVHLLEGDCFKLMAQPDLLPGPVGVYFYDGEHTLLSHYLALAVVEPLLADEALVLVDDATWPVVKRAHQQFIKRHPGWQVAECWDAREADDPLWANGLHALVYRRPPGAGRELSRTDEALRYYQAHVQDRLNSVAWKAAARFPGPAKEAARWVMGRSRKID